MAKKKQSAEQCWRSFVLIDHPSNGKGCGGAIVSTKFAVMVCGHSKAFPASRTPKSITIRCQECEAYRRNPRQPTTCEARTPNETAR